MAGDAGKVPIATTILRGIGAPVNSQNIGALVGWFNAEGGHWNNSARYNPLNTTQGASGARSINGVGVKAYQNWQQGIAATVQTLRNGHYGGILQAFRQSNPRAVAQAIGASPWGTSGQTVAQTIAAATGEHLSPSGGAVPGMSLSPVPGSSSVPVTSSVFNQAGFNQARSRYIAGTAVKALTGPGNPFNETPGASRGFSAGLGSAEAPLFARGLLSTSAPNPANYVSQQTRMQQVAVGRLQQLSGSPLVNAHAGAQGDVNPIPGAVIGRTDMGVDANLKPGAPIVAPNDVKVLGIMPNWYAGQPYVAVQILRGPNAGRVMYVAEQITGLPRAGQVIRRGQPIARYAGSGTGIEIGWASPHNWQQTLAQATGNTGDASHNNAPAGVNFRSFLGHLGA